MPIASKGMNFKKDYQKDSYNIKKLMREKKKKNLLITFKKHSHPKLCGNLKHKNSKNFPKLIQNSRISKVFTTYKLGIM
jgi:hypothetical protein